MGLAQWFVHPMLDTPPGDPLVSLCPIFSTPDSLAEAAGEWSAVVSGGILEFHEAVLELMFY